MRRILLALALILPLAACGGGDQEAEVGEHEGEGPSDAPPAVTELSYLEGHVGSYPAEVELWAADPLGTRLQALLGDQYETFVENIAESGPIAEEEGMVYVMGNKKGGEGMESALLVADVANDNVKVWVLSDGNVSEYVEKDMFVKLPSEAVVHIAGWNEGS
jgi:hypothetical protein